MPLVVSTLASGIQSAGQNPPDTAAQCAQLWADAVQGYAAAVVPASTTVAAAAAALSAALSAAFANPNMLAAPAMELAFAAFGATVSGGMAPSFVGVPPPGPVGFAAQFAGQHPSTHADAGQQIATLIDTWMRTGTATPSGGGSPVNWT